MKMEKCGVDTGGRILGFFVFVYTGKKGNEGSTVSPNLSLMCLNKQPN